VTDYSEIAKEIDRLFTEGHQASSLLPAVQKKFPKVTQTEFDDAMIEIIADRRRRVERMERELLHTRPLPVE
jgi:hypothetical protein